MNLFGNSVNSVKGEANSGVGFQTETVSAGIAKGLTQSCFEIFQKNDERASVAFVCTTSVGLRLCEDGMMSRLCRTGWAVEVVDEESRHVPLQKGATDCLRIVPVHAQGKGPLLRVVGPVECQKVVF